MTTQEDTMNTENDTTTDPAADVELKSPDFSQLTDTGQKGGSESLTRFFDVNVTVSAELGRVSVPIGQLVELTEGSVIELNRPVTTPVDLMAQGVRVATGEVVVVDDCFAIRIKSIESMDQGLADA